MHNKLDDKNQLKIQKLQIIASKLILKSISPYPKIQQNIDILISHKKLLANSNDRMINFISNYNRFKTNTFIFCLALIRFPCSDVSFLFWSSTPYTFPVLEG